MLLFKILIMVFMLARLSLTNKRFTYFLNYLLAYLHIILSIDAILAIRENSTTLKIAPHLNEFIMKFEFHRKFERKFPILLCLLLFE